MAIILNQPSRHHLLNGILDSIPSPPKGLSSSATTTTTTRGNLTEPALTSEINAKADISGTAVLISSLLTEDSVDDSLVSNTSVTQATSQETIKVGPGTSKKVIIVGAGISGLRAAAILLRHGVEVLILEGREDRIGGRICTSRAVENRPRDIGNYT